MSRAAKATPKPTLQAQMREAYKQAILDAAEDVFSRAGFHEAKMADIAERAGVATGTLYNYFKSKDHVFEALSERSHQAFSALVAPAAAIPDPLERLIAIVSVVLDFLEQRGALFAIHVERTGGRLSKSAEPNSGRDELSALITTTIAEAQSQGLLRADISAEFQVHSLLALIESVVGGWLRDGRKEPLADKSALAIKLFVEGAGN